MKLIKGAKTWWRWWSTWITALGVLIFNIDTVEAFLNAYNALPMDFTNAFPPEWQKIAGTVTLFVGFLARFPRQKRANEIANKTAS